MSKRKARKKPADEATFYIQSSKDKPGLVERFIDDQKGRDVFATQPSEQGDFILEYRGQLLSVEKCQTSKYSEKESTFLFDFEWQNHYWCIDASTEDGSLGRLLNDNHKSPNCTMKKIIVNDEPHLCLFAIKNIEMGTEIDYNYGDSKWPWHEEVTGSQAPVDGGQLEPDRCLLDSYSDDSIEQHVSLQVTGSQAPVDGGQLEPDRSLQDSYPDDSIKQHASLQVKKKL
ncbi:N-lysine methyltransferase KMT5A-A-like isoform X2 [Syngnathus typhle]|uniref:N-lysine methyltransferase KMT5A-A-like isoform X2 n=1 Tax=Syngnathus typhle TaxID=161592 RepID=UPI002A6A7B23|nr:N-lysine methyltransferase KMT5A-A-like isoform X2 [Syngnathus typhle]